MCGRLTIPEVEELVEPAEIDPNHVHTPGVVVQNVVPLARRRRRTRQVEKRGATPVSETTTCSLDRPLR